MRLAVSLLAVMTLLAPAAARAESPVVETGVDAVPDTTLGDTGLDAADPLDTADADTAVEDTIADSAVTETEPDTGAEDAGTDTRKPVADTAIEVDAGRTPGPGTVTEDPNDPYTHLSDTDGCTCQTPRSARSNTVPFALLALSALFLRRKPR